MKQNSELIKRLKELKPLHISPYNLGDMGEIGSIIDKMDESPSTTESVEIKCVNCSQPLSACVCGQWEPDYTLNMHGAKIPDGCKLGYYCNYPECHCEHKPKPSTTEGGKELDVHETIKIWREIWRQAQGQSDIDFQKEMRKLYKLSHQ